jgi:hypothetical protein
VFTGHSSGYGGDEWSRARLRPTHDDEDVIDEASGKLSTFRIGSVTTNIRIKAFWQWFTDNHSEFDILSKPDEPFWDVALAENQEG